MRGGGISSLDALTRRLAELPARARATVQGELTALAGQAADEARRELDAAKGGAEVTLQATGDPDGVRLVATGVEAVRQEYGTRKRPARPFLRPAVERVRDDGKARLGQALAALARNFGRQAP